MILLYLLRALMPGRASWTPTLLIVGLLLAFYWWRVLFPRAAGRRSPVSHTVAAGSALMAGAGTVLVAFVCIGLLSLLVTLARMHL